MNQFFDRLNLTPQERRLVVGVGLVTFVVLNFWFVWPHFADWKKVGVQQERVEGTLVTYQKEISRMPEFQGKLRELESAGSSVVPAEQELDLARTVELQARLNRVNITGSDPRAKASTTKTNQFFHEQTMNVRVRTGNEELVNFLVSLASTNSLIRVRDLTLTPNPPQNPTDLNGNITLVASYQKRVPGVAPSVAAGEGSAVEPASAPAAPGAARQTNTTQTVTTSSTNQGFASKATPPRPVPTR